MMSNTFSNTSHASIFYLCFCSLAWAERRGYKTAKAARNDVYRAANSLLRLAIDGRLCLCLKPPGYSCLKGNVTPLFSFKRFRKVRTAGELEFIYLLLYSWSTEHWENHPDLAEIVALQGRTEEEGTGGDDDDDGESSTEPEEERDRDADDDEDGDDEDEGFGHPKPKEDKPSGFTVNMYNVLRENECE